MKLNMIAIVSAALLVVLTATMQAQQPKTVTLTIPKTDLRVLGVSTGSENGTITACGNTLIVHPTTPGVTKSGSKYNVTFYWIIKRNNVPYTGPIQCQVTPSTYNSSSFQFTQGSDQNGLKNTANGLTAGTPLTLVLKVDPNNKIPETNESNNSCTIRILVQE